MRETFEIAYGGRVTYSGEPPLNEWDALQKVSCLSRLEQSGEWVKDLERIHADLVQLTDRLQDAEFEA